LALFLFFLFCFGILWGCGAGGDSKSPSPSPTPTPTPAATAASISLSASPATVKSDGSTTTTISVNALNSSNAAISGVVVAMSTDTGVLGAPTVTTSATTPATVTFYSSGNATNRTATITATAGTVSSQIPVQIVGSTVTLVATPTSIPSGGTSTITVTAKDAGGNVVPGATVTLTQAGSGSVTIAAATGPTNNSGVFTTTITGATSGAVTLTATAVGATATQDITVTAVGANFEIDQQKLNGVVIANNATTPMKIGDTLELQVNAPGAARVTFATTIGVWDGGAAKSVTKAVVAGKAKATLTTTQAGVANIQVYDNLNNKDTRTVAMSSGLAAFRIKLEASPTNVPVSVGTTTGSATLIATVYDAASNPVGGVQVLFSMVNPTSGGENVLPVVVSTSTTTDIANGISMGQAKASFTAGSMPSGAGGIQINASVIGTAVATNTAPSGNDAIIIIGGVAGSIAFGQATSISELNAATYSWPMSVLVSDASGAAVANADINLSVWPIAWSTGGPCAFDLDNGTNMGTFWGEDINENLTLDAGEDGYRKYYTDGKPGGADVSPGTVNGVLTPVNSAAGTVPSKVTTDANGVATFKLNYPKQSAIWTVVRLRATTKVQGTETRSELILRLAATSADTSPCILGSSPYIF
jgi:hypothetical protein